MGADEVEGADRTSASAAQAVRERVEAVRASVDIAQALGSDDSVIDLKTFQKLKAASTRQTPTEAATSASTSSSKPFRW